MKTIFQKATRITLCLSVIASGFIQAMNSAPQQAFAAPIPTIAITPATTNARLGSNVQFNVAFDNAALVPPLVGYGPYLDVRFPLGVDGAVAAPLDGLSFIDATFLGQSVEQVANFFCGVSGSYVHPLTGLATPCTPRQQVVVLRLPFGSFTDTQPPASVLLNTNLSNLADVGVPISLTVQPGFQFGASPTGTVPITGSVVSADVTPTLFDLTKTYVGPEDETATGPNFPRTYNIQTSIAATIPLTNLVVTDNLPNTIAYISGTITTAPTAVISNTPAAGVAASPNTLRVRYPSVTGSASAGLSFFVPLTDSTGARVLDPVTGAPRQSVNDVVGSATWSPIDPRDVGGVITSNVTISDHILTDKSIATQKGVTVIGGDGTVRPGAVLEYALDVQVSDFFAFNGVIISDTMPDGLRFDTSFTPTLEGSFNSFTLTAANMAGVNYSVTPDYSPTGTTGTTGLAYRVSNELQTRGRPNGNILGGCIITSGVATPNCNTYNDGATTMRVTYRAIVQDSFTDNPAGISLDALVKLNNTSKVSGNVLNTNTFAPTGGVAQDGAGQTAQAGGPTTEKSIYAIEGVVCSVQPCPIVPLPITNGASITFRLKYTLPTGDFRGLRLDDYLPLPVFDVSEMIAFTPTISAAAPATGYATYGPSHTLSLSNVLTMSTNITANAVSFVFGPATDALNQPRVVDILFTIPAADRPFVDGLLFSNLVQTQMRNAQNVTTTQQSIVQMKLLQPAVSIKKGVVATDNPSGVFTPTVTPAFNNSGACPRFSGVINSAGIAANPIDSNLRNVDGGDRVTYALILENTGSSPFGAFDVTLSDTLPAQATFVPGSLCVSNGAGETITTTGTLTQGLTLNDPSVIQGALARGRTQASPTLTTTGKNIAIVTYDVILNTGNVQPPVAVGSTVINTATLYQYTALNGGFNFLGGRPLSDTARVDIASPALNKLLAGSEISNTYNTAAQIAVGELITYSIVITVPEGRTPNAILTDTLDAGLVFAKFITISASSNITRSGGFAAIVTPTVTNSGRTATWNAGDVFNSNINNPPADVITITYTALAENIAGNVSGQTRRNNAQVTYAVTGTSPLVNAPAVTIVEPQLAMSKANDANRPDAGDTVIFTLTLTNTAAAGIAYDTVLTDLVPAGLTYVAGSLSNVSGPAATFIAAPPLLTATWATNPISPGATSIITFAATLDTAINPNQVITNFARTSWTSLPGFAQPITRSIYSANSTERDGSGGVNTYSTTAQTAFTSRLPGLDKQLVTTEISNTSNTRTQVTIGELVTYTIVLTMPEGTSTNLVISDVLPTSAGNVRMAFVQCNSISASGSLATSIAGGFNAVCAAPTVQESGRVAIYNFGTVTNTNTDNSIAETIRFTYTTVALNVANNSAGGTLRNTASLSETYYITSVQTPNLDIIEPSIGISKSVTPALGDNGDPITYTIVLTGASGTTAYDVVITDALPTALFVAGSLINNPVLQVNDSAGLVNTGNFNIIGSSAAGYTLTTVSSFDMPLSATRRITLTISGNLSSRVVPDQIITNTATTQWSSLDGDVSAPRSTFNTNAVERVYPPISSTAQSKVFELDPQKAIVATSEPSTSAGADNIQRGAIGEIFTYRLRVRLAETANPGLRMIFTDALPAGMGFLTNTVRIGFFAQGPGITSTVVSTTTPGCAGLNINTGTDPLIAPTGIITCPFPNAQVNVAGNSIGFDFGNVSNNQSDLDAEYVAIQFNAQALNVSTNVSGTRLNNTFTVTIPAFASIGSTVYPTNSVIIAEPRLSMSKVVTPATGIDAGDLVTFTLVTANATGANATTAFDSVLTDVIDSRLALQTPITIQAPGYAVVTNTTAGNVITVSVNELRAGDRMTITAVARIVNDTAIGSAIPNTVTTRFTSLPGISGTVPNSTTSVITGTPGSTYGERDGSGGVNNYTASAGTSLTLTAPLIRKGVIWAGGGQPQLTIGDAVTFTLLITLPEGTTQNVSVLDSLPAGLVFSSSQVITQAAASGSLLTQDFSGTLPTPAVTQPGGNVLFAFGNITTTDDNNPNNNSFLIRITTRVANIDSNQNGTILTNTAALTYTNPISGVTNVPAGSVNVRVIEPRLTAQKSVTPITAQAGDTLTYTARFTNTGESTAFDVTMTDTLPAGVAQPALVSCAISNTVISSTLSGTPPNIAISPTIAGAWDVPVGQALACSYTVVAQNSLSIHSTFTNTADADWSSREGDDPNQRVYDDSNPNIIFDGPQDTATSTFNSQPATLSKSDGGTITATIGSVIRYTLTFTSPLGTVRSLIITDALPTGMGYVPGSSAISSNISPAVAPSISGANIVWNFGDALITPTNVVTITFSAVVSDVGANVNGAARNNIVTATYRDALGAPRPALTANDGFTIVEPNLIISKAALPQRTPSGAGDTVTYTLRVTNTGASPAFEVVITDALPSGLTFIATQGFTVTNSATLTDANIAPSTQISYGVSQMDVNAVATITFTARITDNIAASIRLTNTAQSFYSSLAGVIPNERSYTSPLATAPITTGLPALPISKVVTPTGLVAPGDLLTYTITTSNTGIVTATGVIITDAVPAGTAFVTASLPFAGPSPVQWNIGNFEVGGTRTFTMVVQATSLISGTQLVNVARVSSNEGVSNTARVTNTLGLADVAVVKEVEPESPIVAGESLTWTITYRNIGNVPAYDVVITDTPPTPPMDWNGNFTATPPLSSPVQGKWIITPSLAPGASGTIVFTTSSQINTSLSALLTNTVYITTSSVEVRTDNNRDTAVSPALRLALTKQVYRTPVNIGELISFTLRLTNTGGFTLTTVPLTDTFDTTVLQYVSALPLPSNTSAGQLTWNNVGGPLPVGQSTSVVVTFRALSATIGTTNIAVATGEYNGNFLRKPVTATADVQITTPALVISKTSVNSDGDPLRPGERITYTIVVTNAGDGTANNVTISDTLPAFTTFVVGSTAINGASGTAGVPPALASNITLAAGGVVTVTYAVTVAIPLTNGVSIINTAAVTSTQTPLPVSSTVTDVVSSTHAIAISKSVAPAIVSPDGQLVYTILYTVTGDAPANSVTISDRTPISTTFVSANGSPVVQPAIGGVGDVVWSIGNLLPATSGITQATGSRQMTVKVDGVVLTGTHIVNGAIITDAAGLSNTAQATATVVSAHDLAISKRALQPIAAPGDLVTFTLTYSITGNEPSLGTTISDVLPSELAFVNATPVPTSVETNTLVWSLGDQSPTKTATITITARITDTPLLSGTQFVNRAGITDTQGITRTSDATVTINSARDLQLSKRVQQVTAAPGDLITYTIAFSKTGNAPALDVTLSDLLPANTTYITSTPVATQSGQSLVWSFGTLVQTTTQFITVTVQANAPLPNGTQLVNTATLTDAQGIARTDQATTTIVSSHALELRKEASPLFLAPGEQVTYTLQYTVTGNEPANGVTLTDTLPAGVSFLASDPAPSLQSGQTQTWNFGTLNPVLTAPVTGTVMVTAQLSSNPVLNGTTFTNTARLSDASGLGSDDKAVITAVTSHTLAITKTATPEPAIAGTQVTYNIDWAVNGNEPSLGTTVRDTLPAGTTFASCSNSCTHPSTGSGGNEVTWSLGNRVPPANGSVQLVVNIAPSVISGTVLLNTATITDAQGVTASDDASTTVHSRADVAVVKRASPSPVFAGETLTYTLVVSNNGPSDAQAVVLTDVLPAEITLLTCSASGASCITAGNSITVQWATLALNAQQHITLTAKVSSEVLAGSSIMNTAFVTSTTPDPNPNNNTSEVNTPVVARADLAIVKSVSPIPATAGETVTYTLAISNAGPSAAQFVTVTDTLPAQVTFVSCTGTCSNAGNAFTVTLPSMSVGQSEVITVVATVNNDVLSGTLIANTAFITSSTPDPNPINNSDDATTTVKVLADPGIIKTASPEPVIAGERLTYTLAISNNGPSAAQFVTVTDVLPAQLAFVSCAGNGSCSDSGNAVTITFPSLAVGQSETITIVTTVNNGVLSGTIIANTAAITSSTPDPNPGNNNDDVTAKVEARADLGIVKSASPEPVIAGERLTYTLAISNAGPSAAQYVTVTDVLPAQVTFVSCTGNCTNAGNAFTVTLPSLSVGQSAYITVVTTVNNNMLSGTLIANTAFITSSTPDPNPINNNDDVTTTVEARADLAIVKRATPAEVVAGETLTYTLVVSNSGPSAAQFVTVTDALPAQVSFVSCTSNGLCSGANSAVTITFPSLAVGQSEIVTIVTTVNNGVLSGTQLSNTAAITSATPDPNPGNNNDGVNTPVVARADLAIVKSVSPTLVIAGERLTYTLAISNAGPSDAQYVTVTDVLPAQVTFVSCTSSCTHAGNALTVTLPSLAVGQSETITVVATVNANVLSGTVIANTAFITSSTPDPNPINNSDDATTTVKVLADLGIVKTASPEPVIAGQTLTYRLVYSNAGPSDAQQTRITDTLPAGVSFGGVSSATPALPAPSVNGSTVAFDPGTLAAGASGNIVFTVTVNGDAASVITNAVQIGSPTPDPNPINNNDDVSTTVWFADVAIAKSVEPTRAVIAGETLTYTLTVSNLGNAPAQNVVVSDVVPAGLTWNGGYSATLPASLTPNLPQLAWAIGTLPAGASGRIVFTVTVNGDNAALVRYTNHASISTTTPQTNTSNDNAQTTSSRLLLAVDKTASASSVVVGQPVSFTLRIDNIGDATVMTVPVTDTYDAAILRFVDASVAPSASSAGVLTWSNVGPIAAGGNVQIVVNFVALTTTFGANTTNTMTATGSITEVTLPPVSDTAQTRVTAPALGVLKTSAFDGNALRPGNRLTYTIVISNSGDAAATGVLVSDTLPALTAFVPDSVSINPPSGNAGTPPIIANNLTVPSGGAVTVTFAVTVAIPLTDGVQIVNTVAVSSSEVPTRSTSTVTDTVRASHTLEVRKTASASIVAPGDTLTYTLRYTVTGDGPVEDLRLRDTLPAELSYVASLPPASNVSGSDIAWDLGNVLTATEGITQATGSVLLVARVGSPLPNGLIVTNTVALSDRSETQVEDTVTTTIAATHTLQLVKRVEPALASPNQSITYTLAYTLSGNEPVRGVGIRDTTPANTTFVNASPAPAIAPVTGGMGEVRWELGDFLLASSGITQATGVVTLVVRADDPLPADITTISNTATIEDASGQRDASTVTQTVPADVAVMKTVSPALVLVSDLVTYTLVVSNNGPGLAQNVIVTDALPAGMTLVSASGNPINTNPLVWVMGDLLAGQAITLQVVARAPATNNATLLNLAQISTSSPETRTDNNTSQVTVTTGLPTLRLTKRVAQGSGIIVMPNDVLTYTLVVTNEGSLAATNVQLRDDVPQWTSYVEGSATPVPVTNTGTILVWDAGTLQPGQVFSASFEVRVSPALTGGQSIRNTALVSSRELTPTDSNEVVNPLPPTAITLASFTAKRVNTNTVQIDWATSSERNTYGFRLLRSTTPNVADAVYVMELMPALGGNVLTPYQFVDTTAPSSKVYYWLEETETSGLINSPYGPVSAEAQQPETPTPPENPFRPRIYLPVVMR